MNSEQKSNSFLETEKIGKLMRKYAIPCIISLVVAALYNIVDQIFIANADYLGSYGNAANTVVFPMTVIALAFAVMIGDGCCAFTSICLGSNKKDDAHKSVGCAIVLCLLVSAVLTAVYLIFSDSILTLFGGQVNSETFEYSKEYFFWITLGMPFYIFGQAMNPIIRSDGSPKFAMFATLAGAITNIISDINFSDENGYDGRSSSDCYRSGTDGGAVNRISVPHEGNKTLQKELRTGRYSIFLSRVRYFNVYYRALCNNHNLQGA